MVAIPELTTERLVLRAWLPGDHEPFARLNADPRVMLHNPSTLSLQESDVFVSRIEAHVDSRGFGLWAAALRSTNEFIGFTGLAIPSWEAHFTPCVEIGWRRAAAHWNQGYATEGTREAMRYGFQSLHLDEILSFTVPANAPSRRVMEKLGMTHNPGDVIDHPRLPEGHPPRRHVVYRRLRQVPTETAARGPRRIC